MGKIDNSWKQGKAESAEKKKFGYQKLKVKKENKLLTFAKVIYIILKLFLDKASLIIVLQ